MSKKRKYVDKCHWTGKISHKTEKAAKKYLNHMRKIYKYEGNVYYCKYCWAYHLGRKDLFHA